MKAIIHSNEKAVIRIFINKGEGWQYTAKPEDSSNVTAAQIVNYITTGKGNDVIESFVLDLEGQLSYKTIEQLIFNTHQMKEILSDIVEGTEDQAIKDEIMFLEDLYASKYPLTQNPDTDKITSEDKDRYDGMETYREVLVSYIVSGLFKTGMLSFSAELQR